MMAPFLLNMNIYILISIWNIKKKSAFELVLNRPGNKFN